MKRQKQQFYSTMMDCDDTIKKTFSWQPSGHHLLPTGTDARGLVVEDGTPEVELYNQFRWLNPFPEPFNTQTISSERQSGSFVPTMLGELCRAEAQWLQAGQKSKIEVCKFSN